MRNHTFLRTQDSHRTGTFFARPHAEAVVGRRTSGVEGAGDVFRGSRPAEGFEGARSAISRAAPMKAFHATRAGEPPTEIRRTPRPARCAAKSVGSPEARTLTGWSVSIEETFPLRPRATRLQRTFAGELGNRRSAGKKLLIGCSKLTGRPPVPSTAELAGSIAAVVRAKIRSVTVSRPAGT